jgi:protein gp37
MTDTEIEWTDKTWNPLTGCTKVSPGCDNCYAKTMHERFNGPGSFDTITLHPERLTQPLKWRKPAKVFVNSMSDLFHKDVPDQYIADVFAVMAVADRHTFQVLTKRPSRMRSLLSSPRWSELLTRDPNVWPSDLDPELPLPNVWLGVSVEDQHWADIRIPALLDTPAAVRFLSCEPLLGPVDLRQAINQDPFAAYHFRPGGIDWVIVGGESGPGARPMRAEWARDIRTQCLFNNVPFLFKQWGNRDATGKRMSKKAAGRELDGRFWDEYPATP